MNAQNRPLPMALFAAAALLPIALFAIAIGAGGIWAWLPFLYITAFAGLMDYAAPLFMGDAPEGAEYPASNPLLAALGTAHLVILPVLVTAIAADGPALPRLGLFLGGALWLGQIITPAAHELIHRGNRGLFGLGALIYGTVLFGHHTSAHRLVHHHHVATPNDPNTARSGEGFYAFFLRAWRGSFIAGLRAENALRARKSVGKSTGLHPYVFYGAVAAVSLTLGYLISGFFGVLIWGAASLAAQSQLMLSDYVQHYGLLRKIGADGRSEPVGDRHSWNAPYWFSSAMMLNAPRHSDHHAHPSRPFPALRVTDGPMLPWPLPLACTIALIPPLWKRKIRPHLKPWLIQHIGL